MTESSLQKWTYHDWQTWAACAVFFCTWLLIAKKWIAIPIGRTAGALLGAVMMVQLGVLTPKEANDCIETGTLLLLVGLMIILAILETKGVVDVLINLLLIGSPTPLTLLVRISLLSGCMAAFIMNDGAALFLSAVVIKLCNKYDMPLKPFMIGMATSANIGSAATVLGNPKNMVIHAQASIDFLPFLKSMGPPSLLGLLLNSAFMYWFYRDELAGEPLLAASSDLLESGGRELGKVSKKRSTSSSSSSPPSDRTSDSDDEDDPHAEEDRSSMGQQLALLARRQQRQGSTLNLNLAGLTSGGKPSSDPSSSSLSLLSSSSSSSSSSAAAAASDESQPLKGAGGGGAAGGPLLSRSGTVLITRQPTLLMGSAASAANTTRYSAFDLSTTTAGLGESASSLNLDFEVSAQSMAVVQEGGPTLLLRRGGRYPPGSVGRPLRLTSFLGLTEESKDFYRTSTGLTSSSSPTAGAATALTAAAAATATALSTNPFSTSASSDTTTVMRLTRGATTLGVSTGDLHRGITVKDKKPKASSSSSWLRLPSSAKDWTNIGLFLSILGMYLGFLFEFDLGWTCLCGALFCLLVERKDPAPYLAEVNYQLLLYIVGLFVVISGVNRTPLASVFWDVFEPFLHKRYGLLVPVLSFSMLILLLCLVFTSIPCVLLVAPHLVAANAAGPVSGTFGWLCLAWSVTLCGNLTMFSSVAGVIAGEAAATVDPIQFMDWFRFALPSTALITLVGAVNLACLAGPGVSFLPPGWWGGGGQINPVQP